MVALAKSLQSCSSLRTLWLYENCIGQTGGNGTLALANTLPSLPYLQDLRLTSNYIGSSDPNSTVSLINNILQLENLNSLYMLQQNQTIPFTQWDLLRQYWNYRSLDTDLYTFISTDDVQYYLKSLSSNTTFVSLAGQLFLLSDSEQMLLMDGLSLLPNLQTLDLSNNLNLLGNNGLNSTILAHVLSSFRSLTSLNLTSSLRFLMNENNTRPFVNALPPSLTLLNLSENTIGSEEGAAVALGQGLGHLTNLQSLDLSTTDIGYQGTRGEEALGKSLKNFPYLTYLDLSENSIGGSGVNGTLALAEGLNSTHMLKSLDLSYNYIGFNENAGAEALISIMPRLICNGLT